MSGIETAVAGGLIALLFKQENCARRHLCFREQCLAFGIFVAMGLALFCSAWILSSLPSQALRLKPDKEKESEQNDIYEKPLYGFIDRRKGSRLKLGFVLSLQQWLWGIGLVLAAAFFLFQL
jgi:hypothetical protein